MEKHIQILAILHIALGLILLLVGIGVFLVLAGAGAVSGDADAFLITGFVGSMIALILLVLALPEIIAGFGLLRRRNWARILSLVLGAVQLFNFPFGTALGIYTFWVLLNEEATPLFTSAARVGSA